MFYLSLVLCWVARELLKADLHRQIKSTSKQVPAQTGTALGDLNLFYRASKLLKIFVGKIKFLK